MSEEREIKCPICNRVTETDYFMGQTINVCAGHGVWLDEGEMQAMTERAREFGPPAVSGELKSRFKEGVFHGWLFGVFGFFFE